MRTLFYSILLLACIPSFAFDTPPCVLLDESYGEKLPASNAQATLWWASSGWKVAQTRKPPVTDGPAMRLSAARNETEAAQFVMTPAATLHGFTVSAAALTGPGGATLPANTLEILQVRYVPIAQKTDRKGMVAPWPDPLPPLDAPLDLAAAQNHPFWVRAHVPADATPGRYEGGIALHADGYEATVGIVLDVYGFTLPDKMTLQTAFGFNGGSVCHYQNISDPAQQRAVIDKYYQSMADHHITPYNPAPNSSPKVTWGQGDPGPDSGFSEADRALFTAHPLLPTFEWADWDAELKKNFERFHFTSINVGIPGVRGDLQGFAPGTREHYLAMRAYGKALEDHLEALGLLDAAYIYWTDEPEKKDYPGVMEGFQQLKQAAPKIRRMLTEQVEPELAGGPNLWCPLTMWYDHARAEQRRAAGDRFWWYVCTVPKWPYPGEFIDDPGTDLRVWLWQTWKYGIEGILIWHTNLWTTSCAYPEGNQNPYEDPMAWMEGYGTQPGQRLPWGNGDGRFMYPPVKAGAPLKDETCLDGPVDSIRWEMLRDGIEDYEYMALLKRALEQAKPALSAKEYRGYERLLKVPEGITKDLKTYTLDPAPIERHRERVARAIEALEKR